MSRGNMRRTFSLISSLVLGLAWLSRPEARGAEATAVPTQDNVRYLGATTCQSSMCHGGASTSRGQFTIWSRKDFHSRAYATLTTPRATRIAESLGISVGTQSARCTICHAPLETFPGTQVAPTADVTEGVSCEQCHGPAQSWLRGHTRPDWTYADRVHAGMRDLRRACVRATTCVACHQVLDPALLQAGHPELTFELDGQTASEPRHWREKEAWFGPKAWLVGQAVALSEICRNEARIQSLPPGEGHANSRREQDALVWLLSALPFIPKAKIPADQPQVIAAWSDQLARQFSEAESKPDLSRQALAALAGTSDSFADPKIDSMEQALRAERLVLALDRLTKSLNLTAGSAELSELFAEVQDRDRFDAAGFAATLKKFGAALPLK